MSRKLIGTIPVDTGVIALGDPCYLFGKSKKYDEAHNVLGNVNYGEFGKKCLLSFRSGLGDGMYPVYATEENGIVVKVTIEMKLR